MASGGQAAGIIMIILGALLLFYPTLIPGITAQNNCPANEGVTVNVSPSSVLPGSALSLSGYTYPQSGSCPLIGVTVYYSIVGGASGSTVSSSINGNWASGILAPSTPGQYSVLASVCAYPHLSCNVCSEPSGVCQDGSATFTVSNNPPPTYSVTIAFSDSVSGTPISGVFVVVTQGSQSFGTGTSGSNGQVTIGGLPSSSTQYVLSYQPGSTGNNLIYKPGSVPFTISGSSITLNQPLQPYYTTSTTTTTAVSTTWTTTYTTLPPTTTTQYTTGTGGSTGTCVSFGIFQNSVTIQPGAAVSFTFTTAFPIVITGSISIQAGQGQGTVQLNQGSVQLVSQTVGGSAGSYTFNQNLSPGSYQILILNGALFGITAQTFSGSVQAQCSFTGGNGFNLGQLLPYGLIFGGMIVVAGSSRGGGSSSRRRS